MNRTFYGSKSDGAAIHAYTLSNDRGLRATILDMGGTITAITVPVRGAASRNVVLGLENLAAYEASGWWGCLVGRFANRIGNGFTLDGKHFTLPHDADGVTLHGGREQTWGTRVWDVTEASGDTLGLRLVSPDGDQGFPGKLTVDVTYTLQDDGLKLDYAAATEAPTPVNFTNHIYFNLKGQGGIAGQLLTLNADAFTPTDARQIPTGEIAPVAGTPFDFRTPTTICARVDSDDPQIKLARGYDHNVVLNKSAPGALDWAARLQEPESGLVLEVLTTEPGCQVYSTNNVKGTQKNAAGAIIQRRDALALETQHFPDSPNQPGFPDTILRPGRIFRSTTLFRFP